MATASQNIVVWEWQDDNGQWCPYPGHISNYVEGCYNTAATQQAAVPFPVVNLGQIDQKFSAYVVDLNHMVQARLSTTRQRPIRRRVYLSHSLMAQGIEWQWQGDFSEWHTYNIVASQHLEDAHSHQQPAVDLSQHVGLPYTVNISTMTQHNHRTAYVRAVRRVQMPVAYDTEGSRNVAVTGPAATASNIVPVHTQAPTTSVIPASHSTAIPTPSASCNSYGHPANSAISGNSTTFIPGASPSLMHTSFARSISMPAVPSTSHQVHPVNGAVAQLRSKIRGMLNTLRTGTSRQRRGHSPSQPSSAPKRSKSMDCCHPSDQAETDPEKVMTSFSTPVLNPEKEECAICCENLTECSGYDEKSSKVIQLVKCKHHYHEACLLSMYNSGTKDGSLQCPTCMCIHGVKLGNCPPGNICFNRLHVSLPGYEGCETFEIIYNIHGSIQGASHPNPSKPFTARGFPRRAYLPDNEKGQKVRRLLEEAWRRRLTFTIGTSSTTGEPDTVVWNEIHHKTEMQDRMGHGYPDPNYLDNVLKELQNHGVTEAQEE